MLCATVLVFLFGVPADNYDRLVNIWMVARVFVSNTRVMLIDATQTLAFA